MEPQKQIGNTVLGTLDVGGIEPALVSYRFIGSAAGKTATVRLYNARGLVEAEETITVGTTALAATDDTLWAGSWSAEYVGMEVVACDATIYAMASDGSPNVTAANGKALEAGMWFGMVPDRVRHAYAPVLRDSSGRAVVTMPGADGTNDLVKTTPELALGSGGVLTASGNLHTGPCSGGRIFVATTNASAQTVNVYDGTSTGGTKMLPTHTIPGTTGLVSPSMEPIDLTGLSFAIGIYIELGSNCQAVAHVGPPL